MSREFSVTSNTNFSSSLSLKKEQLSWETKHIIASWGGVLRSIDQILPIDFDDILNPDQKIINLLENLGDISICFNQQIDGTSVINSIEKILNKIGFENEEEARKLFEKSLWSNKYIGYGDDAVRKMSQRKTSTDDSVYAYSGRSENNVVITLRLRTFPERIILWQLIQKNRLIEFQNLLEKEYSISWMSKYDIYNTEKGFDWQSIESIAWKLIKKFRNYKYENIKVDDIVSKALNIFSQLKQETPNVYDALNSKTLYLWQRLTNVTFLFALGGDRNSRIPQSVWKQAFEMIQIDKDEAMQILTNYDKENSIPKQLVDYAEDEYFSSISSEEFNRAVEIIDQ